ncbi:MAG: hypothetical protein ACJ8HC_05825, partial [Paraburkholderia graminis]
VLAYELVCRPCAYAVCPYGHECAEGVRPETVIAEARALLERFPAVARRTGARPATEILARP